MGPPDRFDMLPAMKTLPTLILVAAMGGLAGCSAAPERIKAPDGRDGVIVNCDGSVGSWGTCYKDAMAECKGPYDVISQNETSTPTAYGPMVRRHLVAACKTAKP